MTNPPRITPTRRLVLGDEEHGFSGSVEVMSLRGHASTRLVVEHHVSGHRVTLDLTDAERAWLSEALTAARRTP